MLMVFPDGAGNLPGAGLAPLGSNRSPPRSRAGAAPLLDSGCNAGFPISNNHLLLRLGTRPFSPLRRAAAERPAASPRLPSRRGLLRRCCLRVVAWLLAAFPLGPRRIPRPLRGGAEPRGEGGERFPCLSEPELSLPFRESWFIPTSVTALVNDFFCVSLAFAFGDLVGRSRGDGTESAGSPEKPRRGRY